MPVSTKSIQKSKHVIR